MLKLSFRPLRTPLPRVTRCGALASAALSLLMASACSSDSSSTDAATDAVVKTDGTSDTTTGDAGALDSASDAGDAAVSGSGIFAGDSGVTGAPAVGKFCNTIENSPVLTLTFAAPDGGVPVTLTAAGATCSTTPGQACLPIPTGDQLQISLLVNGTVLDQDIVQIGGGQEMLFSTSVDDTTKKVSIIAEPIAPGQSQNCASIDPFAIPPPVDAGPTPDASSN